MLDCLPPGPSRLARPATVIRYTFERFEAPMDPLGRTWDRLPVIPIEAVQPGDTQVFAAREPVKFADPLIDLDVLADIPSVDSIISSTRMQASRDNPHIRELLFSTGAPAPPPASLRHLTGLSSIHLRFGSGSHRLDLASLPADQMRKLAINRWFVTDLAPLSKMTGLRRLRLDYFRESLATVAAMHQLEYLRLLGPAKSWAALRECTQLEEAHLVEVQIANLRRWNTWSRLRSLTLGGRGIKSLAGLEANQALQDLTLLNLDMSTLSSLRELPHLASLSLRMAETVDLESIASVPRLRTLVIDTARHDNQPIRLPSLRPLERTASLEEITLFDVVIEDRDLTPLAGLNNLKRVRLGSSIGADVGKLRAARPDLEIQYTPPDTRFDKLREQVGVVTIQRPGEGLQDWSIFQDLSTRLGTSTNYAAGSRLKSEIRQRDSQLARRLDWDTEAGAVACYAKTEADIRAVAALINELAK